MAEQTYRRISENLFLRSIVEEYKAGRKFCFILGSGASAKSGIRMGTDLMKEWRAYLAKQGETYIRQCATFIGMDAKEADKAVKVCQSEEVPDSEDYFDLYDLRFANRSEAAFQFLEDEMSGKKPSIGYFALASVLMQTDNRLVLTTNFDSLTEDACFLYHGVHPLVVGHESLAGFIGGSMRRPVVAKIHHDLYYGPMNRKAEMQKLPGNWKKPLIRALADYTPIVIGYAGADHTLMNLLLSEDVQLSGLYWCVRRDMKNKKPVVPPKRVEELLEKKKGCLMEISGFDEFMVRLAAQFAEEEPNAFAFNDPRAYLREQAETYCETYQKQKSDLNIGNKVKELITAEEYREDEIAQSQLGVQKALGQLENSSSEPLTDEERFEQLVREGDTAYFEEDDFKTAVEKFTAALAIKEDAELYFKRANSYGQLNHLQDAIADYTKAIELKPDYASAYYNRGFTYSHMELYDKAIADYNKVIELKLDYASAYYNRGDSYFELKQYDEAIADYTKAIELKPDDAFAYINRGLCYAGLKQYDEAIADYSKAIELNPDDAFAYIIRGNSYADLKQYDKALADYNKAIELKPDYVFAYLNRARLYDRMNRPEDAAADRAKAEELKKAGAV